MEEGKRNNGGKDTRRNVKAASSSTPCIPRLPRLRTSSRHGTSSHVSLLGRFREAVLRLIMLSAVSKGTQRTTQPHRPAQRRGEPDQKAYHDPNSSRSEAVEDCIEFFKEKSVSSADHDDEIKS